MGNYTIVVEIEDNADNEGRDTCSEYLENGRNKFLFRLAASKKCVVEKNKLRVELTLFIKNIYEDVFK